MQLTSPSAQLLVEQLLTNCTFPAPGVPIDCAVSGGADSSALVALGVAAGCVVTAHHVDHGLRGGSANEADHVRLLAAHFGVGFVAHTVTVEPGSNLEARARDARFAVLPAKVVTGHTLDDQAETMLINLLRGAARGGLSPHQNSDRHPILGLRRAETQQLCKALDISVVRDPSNDDPAFVRNRVRHEALPLLQDIASRDLAPLFARQAALLSDEDALLDALASELDPTDALAVTAAPPALARRALRIWIMNAGKQQHPPGGESIERVLEVARGSAVSTEIEGGQRIHRTAQKLRLEPPSVM